MATIAFISICDRNAHGLRMMSADLRRHGHECHHLPQTVWAQSPVGSPSLTTFRGSASTSRGREFRYAVRRSRTELDLLRDVLQRIRPAAIGLSVTTPLRKRNTRVTRFIKSRCPRNLGRLRSHGQHRRLPGAL